MGLLGLVFAGARSRPRDARREWLRAAIGGLGLVIILILAGLLTGCGYSAPASGGTQRTTYTVMITGTSGTLTHSAAVTLTVQ